MSTPHTKGRSLIRARPSLSNKSLNTVSTPNLHAAFKQQQNPVYESLLRAFPGKLTRKTSLNALTSGSLATIPDASEDYPLSAVLEVAFPKTTPDMPPRMSNGAGGAGGAGEVEVGDVVDVPGNMYGTVKFVGSVHGKMGTFAGVELSEEFADKGKNNGDVDGRSYFATRIPGAGIFLPLARAAKRTFPPARAPATPAYGRLGATTPVLSPLTPSKISQSLGPGRAPSPQRSLQKRPSIPRAESPVRRPQTANSNSGLRRPSLGAPQARSRYAPNPTPPTPNRFAQSVRGTQDSRDLNKKYGVSGRVSPSKGPGRSASALGQQPANYSDDEMTPLGMRRNVTNTDSLGSISSLNSKLRPSKIQDEEIERLKKQLDERDHQLREQASALAEMENSLLEVQSLMGGSESNSMRHRGSLDNKDNAQLRNELREKKEKIAMLTAEFDAHRADFRSTIDTLELASTETERVYEQKVQELLNEIRDYQDRTEDVDSVARQLKQLEELVQELEEGLEDARRGEAEARGEVEFLRGEVERGRSELKREREMAAAFSHGDESNLAKEIMQRDDEIRGLKAIIHSLSRDGNPDAGESQRMPTQHQNKGRPSFETADDRLKLEREIAELRKTVDSKSSREEELERELEQLRRGSANSQGHRRSEQTLGSNGTVVPEAQIPRNSHGTDNWRDLPRTPESRKMGNLLSRKPESDAHSSGTDGTEGTLWCQMCETGGHDILNCTNMFGNEPSRTPNKDNLTPNGNGYTNGNHRDRAPSPLSPAKSPAKKAGEAAAPAPRILPNPMEPGPVAGKESGLVDENRWCALCERDGHDSVDCPFEDAF